jgi:hypothetical protein
MIEKWGHWRQCSEVFSQQCVSGSLPEVGKRGRELQGTRFREEHGMQGKRRG